MGSIAITNGTLVDGGGTRRADLDPERRDRRGGGEARRRHDHRRRRPCRHPRFRRPSGALREPGGEEGETIQTGSRGAALGGFTAVVVMPNTTPTIDSAAVVRQIHDLSIDALCEVVPSAAITVDRDGEALAPMAELVRSGVRMFTDDGVGVQDVRHDAHRARVRLGVVASRRRLRDRAGPALRSRRACGRRCNARGGVVESTRHARPGRGRGVDDRSRCRTRPSHRWPCAFPARHHGPWR